MSVASPRAATLLIVNPESGRGEHVGPVARHAAAAGYAIAFTRGPGHAAEIAAAAVRDGVDCVGAVGGDGTLHEVVRGIAAVDGFEAITVAVIPAGTGNGFASNLGIDTIEDGFAALADGARRQLDLGMADGRPFLNSCIAGLTAEASEETDPALKSRLGVFAYVVTTIRRMTSFEGIQLTAEIPGSESVWEGAAAIALIGNARRFTVTGGAQADLEDGRFDVTLVEDASAIELLGEGTRDLVGGSPDRITRFLASSVELTAGSADPITFSLDGEIVALDALRCTTVAGRVRMPVGDGYEPQPPEPPLERREKQGL